MSDRTEALIDAAERVCSNAEAHEEQWTAEDYHLYEPLREALNAFAEVGHHRQAALALLGGVPAKLDHLGEDGLGNDVNEAIRLLKLELRDDG